MASLASLADLPPLQGVAAAASAAPLSPGGSARAVVLDLGLEQATVLDDRGACSAPGVSAAAAPGAGGAASNQDDDAYLLGAELEALLLDGGGDGDGAGGGRPVCALDALDAELWGKGGDCLSKALTLMETTLKVN